MKESITEFLEHAWELVFKYAMILLAFFAPTFSLLAIVGLSILLDTLIGRWAAKFEAVRDGKDPRIEVTSRKTRVGVISKVITYNIAVFTFFLLDDAVLNEITAQTLPWQYISTKIVVLFIVWMEYDSIDEKYYKVKGYRIKDKFKTFIGGLKSLVRVITNLREDLNKNQNENGNKST